MNNQGMEESYITLPPGIPKTLHFTEHGFLPKTIVDPVLKWPKTVQTLVFKVDMLNHRPTDSTFSIISEKLKKEIEPYLEGKKYRSYLFTFIKDGPATMPPRIVEVTPYRK